jgi:predicted PurR-regulated permease PerM
VTIATPPPEVHHHLNGVQTASLVVLAVVAAAFGLYFGREFFVPITFAILLNALFRPVVRRLEGLGLRTPIAAAVVVLALMAAWVGAGFALAAPLQNWMKELPERLGAAETKLDRLRAPVQQVNEVTSKLQHAAQGPSTAPSKEASAGGDSQPAGVVGRVLGGGAKLLSAVVEVLLMLYLLLAAGDLFYRKLIKVIPLWRDKQAATKVVEESQHVVMRYLLVTLLINTGQAVVVGLVMWGLGMPSPLLWGLFTLVLEFVPYLGATVMVAALSVVAFAAFDQMGRILAAPGSYLVITTLQNNVVSPYAYGQQLKLNPVAVLVGVLLWWFLWGIPGAFLAVPIIATVKIVSDHLETLKPVGEFLGE